MITVENDWVVYATVPARPTGVRGGAACRQRTPVVTERPLRPAATTRPAPVPVPVHHRVPSAEPRLRLTRRGRLVLIVLPSVLAATAALVSIAPSFAVARPAQPARTIVVGTGDTLWSIAERIAPRADPRDVVAGLERANGRSGASVRAGETLVVPDRLVD